MALREAFEEFSNRKFIFIAPGGNKGDFLIYQGAFKLADELGLHYKHILATLNWKAKAYDKSNIIYIQGSGGFTPWWDWTPQVLKMLRKANPENHIIIGPSTVDNNRHYLNHALNMDNNMTFFAREYTTFDIIQDYCDDVRLDHDTALHLRFGDGYLRRVVGKFEPRSAHDLLALRVGPEALINLPSEIRRGDFGVVCDPCRVGDWGRLHMHARRIVANRLHSAILGAVLGKDTSIFAGNYHKNHSIWKYSLKSLGVKWIGSEPSAQ